MSIRRTRRTTGVDQRPRSTYTAGPTVDRTTSVAAPELLWRVTHPHRPRGTAPATRTPWTYAIPTRQRPLPDGRPRHGSAARHASAALPASRDPASARRSRAPRHPTKRHQSSPATYELLGKVLAGTPRQASAGSSAAASRTVSSANPNRYPTTRREWSSRKAKR